ncbi:MAG: CRISPR-associated helicase Cas3' [Candidatus Aminicenantes bacterium]|nr:CRISPR-associated helicase Cas3' [Candidatus Aminicenantes bacterium]
MQNCNCVYFWAKTTIDHKPGISVLDHMINVGCIARKIAESFPELLNLFHLRSDEIGALAALHDIGKISPGFQRKCEAWLIENGIYEIARNACWDTMMESDHGKVSHSSIQSFLLEMGIARKSGKYVSAVLGAHHGHLNRPEDRGYIPQRAMADSQSGIEWETERKSHAFKVWDYFKVHQAEIDLTDQSPALWWLAGLTTVSDWIGSDERWFSLPGQNEEIIAELSVKKAFAAIGFQRPILKKGLCFEEIFPFFHPNEMQSKALSTINEPGVYIIEAPMGMGKTEAALGASYNLIASGKANGIYFALPTQATSNRIHIRMNEFLHRITPDDQRSRLIHGNSWLLESEMALNPSGTENGPLSAEDARTGRDWFSSNKRALLASFGVGTIDQALLGVVAAKHFFVRHFALAGKVVILDEVHSYDLYTGTLIDKLITTLEGLGCTVIVLSATLSGKRREEILPIADAALLNPAEQPYPLIIGRKNGETVESIEATPPKSREVEVEFMTVNSSFEEAIQLARSGGTVLWICDTVDRAQEQYTKLLSKIDDSFPLGLLHSRFPFWRREEIEKEWLTRFDKSGKTRCGSILVSTQIVEQSVDLDADLMITELAPTDMLLQRMGRLWRHARRNRPADHARFIVIKESRSLDELQHMSAGEIEKTLGSKAYVYAPYVLLRTLQVWEGLKQIIIPTHIRSLIEATYSERVNDSASWHELYLKLLDQSQKHRQLALINTNVWSQPDMPDEEGVQTRLNELPTVDVVLCRKVSDKEAVLLDGNHILLGRTPFCLITAQGIYKNMIKVPLYCFDTLEANALFENYMRGLNTMGLVKEDGDVEIKNLKSGYRLQYSDRWGLVIKKAKAAEEQ